MGHLWDIYYILKGTSEEKGLVWSKKVCNSGVVNSVSLCRVLSPSDSASLATPFSPGQWYCGLSCLLSLGIGPQPCFQSC